MRLVTYEESLAALTEAEKLRGYAGYAHYAVRVPELRNNWDTKDFKGRTPEEAIAEARRGVAQIVEMAYFEPNLHWEYIRP